MAAQEYMLDLEAASFKGSKFAVNTKATYMTHLRCYLRFCARMEYKPVPASDLMLVRYVMFLNRTLVPGSVKNYLNIIRLLHLEAGLQNPLEDNYAVKSMLKCIERVKGAPPKRKLPITTALLRSFHANLNFELAFDVAFFAACVVCFFTFLRKSSLLSTSLNDHNPDIDLCRKDVKWTREGVVLTVRHTKTIQCKERVLELPLVKVGGVLCPVGSVERMWEMFPDLPPEAPLFSYVLDTVKRM